MLRQVRVHHDGSFARRAVLVRAECRIEFDFRYDASTREVVFDFRFEPRDLGATAFHFEDGVIVRLFKFREPHAQLRLLFFEFCLRLFRVRQSDVCRRDARVNLGERAGGFIRARLQAIALRGQRFDVACLRFDAPRLVRDLQLDLRERVPRGFFAGARPRDIAFGNRERGA